MLFDGLSAGLFWVSLVAFGVTALMLRPWDPGG